MKADHERVDDLVKRLREAAQRKWTDEGNQRHSLFGVAADEIERLRAENDAIRQVADEAELNREGIKAAHAEVRKLRAEVQMLRATIVDSARDVIDWCDKNPPAGDALYCIARFRHALATTSANP